MHPADIKAAIQKAGSSQMLIAQSCKKAGNSHVHKTAVSRVISGSLKSQFIARAVAEVTAIPVSQLWPGKYPQLEMLEALGVVPTAKARSKRVPRPSTTPRRKP